MIWFYKTYVFSYNQNFNNNNNNELLTIRINSSIPVIYCLVYIPPRSSDKYFQELFEFLTSFIQGRLENLGGPGQTLEVGPFCVVNDDQL